MSQLTCTRCNRTGDQLAAPPLPTELGARIYDTICQGCWQEWLKKQTAIINPYALNLLDPTTKLFLTEKTEEFFFGKQSE